MGKVSVIIYITLAVLLLLLVSKSPKNPNHHSHRHRHRRLKLRSNFTFTPPSLNHQEHHVPFDPLVAEIERKREDREWEKKYFEEHDFQWRTRSPPGPPGHDAMPAESQPEWEDFMDAEEYLNDEDKFNVTNRLLILFPKVDVSPTDGFVSEPELTRWNLEQSQKEVLHRSHREFEIHDKNKDGFVSFSEYEPPSWVKSSGSDSFGYDIGWWKEDHFNASDADGDGLLNVTEFNDFLHPADTKNPRLLDWLCKEEVRERDTDKDDKVSFKEFFHGLFDLVRNYEEEDHHRSSEHDSDDSQEPHAKKLFAQLDKDGDGFLSDAELLPIIGKLHPSEHYYAKQQAEYIIQQADSDKDGRLTLNEMIENPYVFYSAIFNDDGDDFEYHDEFR